MEEQALESSPGSCWYAATGGVLKMILLTARAFTQEQIAGGTALCHQIPVSASVPKCFDRAQFCYRQQSRAPLCYGCSAGSRLGDLSLLVQPGGQSNVARKLVKLMCSNRACHQALRCSN